MRCARWQNVKHSEYAVDTYGLSQKKGELSGDKYGRKEILHSALFLWHCVSQERDSEGVKLWVI
jgi:hypothetical protein